MNRAAPRLLMCPEGRDPGGAGREKQDAVTGQEQEQMYKKDPRGKGGVQQRGETTSNRGPGDGGEVVSQEVGREC